MSDRSSDSSCEWVILNENDTDLSSDDIEQSLNFDLNYDAICDAVSDSIRSSLSSEELEWQYEQFDGYTAAHSFPYIEDLDPKEFELECSEVDPDVRQVEGDDINQCASTNEYEDVDFTSVPKIRCYKHNRNDHLNFVLNLMLAVVVSSATGLGIGHFMGWSHKCYTRVTELKMAAASNNLTDIIILKQNVQDVIHETEKQMMFPELLYDNSSDFVTCISAQPEIPDVPLDNNIIPESSVYGNSDVLELKSQEMNHNFSDPNLSQVLDIVPHFNWDKISDYKISDKNKFSDFNVFLPVKVNDNPFYKDEIKPIEFEFSKEFFLKKKDSFKEFKDFHDSEETSSDNINNLSDKKMVNSAEFQLLKQFYIKDANFEEKNNLIYQLRHDLNEVLESLRGIAFRRLNDVHEKYTTPAEDSMIIMELYKDFQNLVNSKITIIENFHLIAEYKTHPKRSIKYLQKMIYSLVDSVDYLMKVSFKPLNKKNKKINVHKFSNNISKVIINFNKKWEKNNRFWTETVEKAKFHEPRERSFKRQSKEWRKNAQFEKINYRKDKFRRYYMQS